MAGQVRKGGRNGTKKYGRNASWCQAYRARGQREINKARRLIKHLIRDGFRDVTAIHAYNQLPILARPKEWRENVSIKMREAA